MAHKTPGSDIWDLALRSQKLWEELADSLSEQGLDPLEQLGWKKTGTSYFFKLGCRKLLLAFWWFWVCFKCYSHFFRKLASW